MRPVFVSLYAQREIHFEEIYADILECAYRLPLRDPIDHNRRRLLANLQEIIGGEVTTERRRILPTQRARRFGVYAPR